MSTALVCTGVQFPDSTIQTTAATALTTITYANRGNLRTTTPSANLTSVAVEGLGVFTYYGNNTEPDDDETCFVVSGSGGAWQLLSPSWDFVYGNLQPNIEYLNNLISSVNGNQGSLHLFATCCINQPFNCLSGSYNAQWSVSIPGATSTDIILAEPINWTGGTCWTGCYCSYGSGTNAPVPYTASLLCNGTVSIYLYNTFYTPYCYACPMGVIPYCGSSTLWAINVLRYC